VGIHDLDILRVVVTKGLLDGVQYVETFLQFLVKLHMVFGLGHLFDFHLELVLLIGSDVVVVVSTLGQSYLEIYLSLLQLGLVVIESLGVVLVESDYVLGDL
jgi:hypothetical protein